jgi:tRNA pseudouridine38-40 synthase
VAATRNVRLTLAYDGTDFRGFAESDGVRTVMGELRRAVTTVVRDDVVLTGAGRTDAGVHAWGQVVSGRLPADVELRRLVRGVNALCGPELAVREAEWVDDDFSARFSATGRSYRYRIWNARTPHPLLHRYSWHVVPELDVVAMNRGAEHLVGEHDFSSFCRRPKPGGSEGAPSLVRFLHDARWRRPDDVGWGDALVEFDVSASSFCHQMVRSIVGALVEVGRGRRSPDWIAEVLAARDRNAAGPVAPPVGLSLQSVDYRGVRWDA